MNNITQKNKKGNGGRPTLPKEQKKDKRVMVYLTEIEMKALQEISSERNISLSNLIRINIIALINKDIK